MLCSLFALAVHAQTRAVSGTVTGADDGQPLIGVNVAVQGSTKGAVTDIDGRFQLMLEPAETVLVISYVGYVTQTVNTSDRAVVDVVMQQDVKTLSDIVVVGYGTQKKSDLTGSVSSVRGSDLTKITSQSAEQPCRERCRVCRLLHLPVLRVPYP